jgi:putative acetyltransferase
MELRLAKTADEAALASVSLAAFGEKEGPVIAELLGRLSADETAAPRLMLVAEDGGELFGYVLFTKVELPDVKGDVTARILAPLAVVPVAQGKGLGGALVNAGLAQLGQEGVEVVFVLGDADYYHRFGFVTAGTLGYAAPHPIAPEHSEAWMVLELIPGVTERGGVQCAAVLNELQYWQ